MFLSLGIVQGFKLSSNLRKDYFVLWFYFDYVGGYFDKTNLTLNELYEFEDL